MTLGLKEKFLRAASSSDELTSLIHRTPWVRILLDRDQPDEHVFSIEVELSLPETAGIEEPDSSEMIDQFSNHLAYLRKLRDLGFELSIIGGGCIYCASKVLDETPEDNLFRALTPP
jgi:hypothetical protein